MKKGHNRVTFKPYTMDQPALLPPTLDELVPNEHLVRVVDQTINVLNIDALLRHNHRGAFIFIFSFNREKSNSLLLQK